MLIWLYKTFCFSLREVFTDKSVWGATLIMADISNNTQSYSTDMFWTDIMNASEYMNATTHSLDSSGTTPRSLKSLIFIAVFFSLIVLANIISLGAFLVEKRLRTYNNYFIINLTILDLLIGIGLGIDIEHWYIYRYSFSQNACKVITGIFSGLVNASNINGLWSHQSFYLSIKAQGYHHQLSAMGDWTLVLDRVRHGVGVRHRSRQRTPLYSAVPSRSVDEYDPK